MRLFSFIFANKKLLWGKGLPLGKRIRWGKRLPWGKGTHAPRQRRALSFAVNGWLWLQRGATGARGSPSMSAWKHDQQTFLNKSCCYVRRNNLHVELQSEMISRASRECSLVLLSVPYSGLHNTNSNCTCVGVTQHLKLCKDGCICEFFK